MALMNRLAVIKIYSRGRAVTIMGNPSHHLGWGEMDYVPRKVSILMQAATSAHGSRNASFYVFFKYVLCLFICVFVHFSWERMFSQLFGC